MKKKIALGCLFSAALIISTTTPAIAHVSVQSKGYSVTAGDSSRLWLSLGHGCTYKNAKYGTSVFQVQVPRSAGKPTPEFHVGFKTSVVASATVDASGVPDYYTVTWTAKSRSYVVDDGTFYDFGSKLSWSATPQKVDFPTVQTCFVTLADRTKKPLYLRWNITDGTSKTGTEDTEFGPAPSVTTKAKA